MIKSEIKKGFTSKGFVAALAVSLLFMLGCEIWLFNYLDNIKPNLNSLNTSKYEVFLADISFMQAWIGIDVFSPFGMTFYLVLFPIIAALPMSMSYSIERNNGYYIYPIAKVGKKTYLKAKYISTFLTGGTVVSIPSIISLMLALMKYPIIPLLSEMHQSPVSGNDFMGEIYAKNPLQYAIIYIFIDFIVAGCLACFAMSLSIFNISEFSMLVLPAMINLLIIELLNSAPHIISKNINFAPYVLVTPSSGGTVDIYNFLGCIGVLTLFNIVAYNILKRRDAL